VEAGGLTIAAGGLNLTGDITLTSGGKTMSHSRKCVSVFPCFPVRKRPQQLSCAMTEGRDS
jgi:hypothetical protein